MPIFGVTPFIKLKKKKKRDLTIKQWEKTKNEMESLFFQRKFRVCWANEEEDLESVGRMRKF